MKQEILLQKELNGFHYEIFEDPDSCPVSDEINYEERIKKFYNREINHYFVTESTLCPCCLQWKIVDSLGGIETETPEKALELFIESNRT